MQNWTLSSVNRETLLSQGLTLTGLSHLGKMTALQKLHLRGTAVTEIGIFESLKPLGLEHSLAKIIVPRGLSDEGLASQMPCTQILHYNFND